MTPEQKEALNELAIGFGFEIFSISERTLTGRWHPDDLPDDFRIFQQIEAGLAAIGIEHSFIGLGLISVNDITPETPARVVSKIKQGHRAGQKSLRKAGL